MALMCHNSYPFVNRWTDFVLASTDLQFKDWAIIENLSHKEYQAYKSSPANKIVSIAMNRPSHRNARKDAYCSVNNLVQQHCINRTLTLLEFHAFLTGMKQCREDNINIFQQDGQLTEAWQALLCGYSQSVISLRHTAKDVPVLNAIAKLTEQMSPQPGLRFMEQLTAKAHQALQHVPAFRPASMPSSSLNA